MYFFICCIHEAERSISPTAGKHNLAFRDKSGLYISKHYPVVVTSSYYGHFLEKVKVYKECKCYMSTLI